MYMREVKKTTARTAMDSGSLQKTAASLLQKSVLQLCKDSVQFGTQLHIMGVLCMTIDNECNDIVVKVNETFRKSDNDVEQAASNRRSPPENVAASLSTSKYAFTSDGGLAKNLDKSSLLSSTLEGDQVPAAASLKQHDVTSASRSDSVSECGFSTCSSSADGMPRTASGSKHLHKRKRSPKKFLLQNWVEKQQRQAAAASSAPSKVAKQDYDALADAIMRRAQAHESTSAQCNGATPQRASEQDAATGTPKKSEQHVAPSRVEQGESATPNLNGFAAPPTIVGLLPLRNVSQQFLPNGLQQHGSLVASLNGYAHAQAALQNAAQHQLAALHNAQMNALQMHQSHQAMRAAYLDLPHGCAVPYFMPMREASGHGPVNVPPASLVDCANELRIAALNGRAATSADLSALAASRVALAAHTETSKHSEGLLKQCEVAARRASVPNSPLKSSDDAARRRDREAQPSILALAEAAEFVQRQSAADRDPHALANGSGYLREQTASGSPPSAVPKWSSPPRVSQSDSVGNHSDEQPAADSALHFESTSPVNPNAPHQLQEADARTAEYSAEFDQSDTDSQRHTARPKSATRKRIGVIRNRPTSGSGTDSIGGLPTSGRRKRISSSFKCNQCASAFATLGELTQHTVADHGAYKCTVCCLHFTQRSNLQRHSLRHVGFKPYQCALCGVEYYRKDHLIRHVSTVHSGTDVRTAVIERLSSSECLHYLERLRTDSHSESIKSAAAADEDDAKSDVVANEDDVKLQEGVFADEQPLQRGVDEQPAARADALLRVVSPNGASYEDVSDDEHAVGSTLKAQVEDELPSRDECGTEVQPQTHCTASAKKSRSDSALSVQEECTVNVRECLASGALADAK